VTGCIHGVGWQRLCYGNFSIDIFDPTITEWKRWLQRFQAAIKIFKIPAAQQVLYLLHYISGICNKTAPADPYTLPFGDLVTNLGEFYAPKPLEITKNFRFHQRKQKEGKSVKDFIAALHKLSIHCNFGPYLKTVLRNQIIFGLSSLRAQSRLLETKELTFDKAVQVAMAMELSEQDSRQLQTGTAVVEYVGTKSHKPESREPRKRKRFEKNRARRKTNKSEQMLIKVI